MTQGFRSVVTQGWLTQGWGSVATQGWGSVVTQGRGYVATQGWGIKNTVTVQDLLNSQCGSQICQDVENRYYDYYQGIYGNIITVDYYHCYDYDVINHVK